MGDGGAEGDETRQMFFLGLGFGTGGVPTSGTHVSTAAGPMNGHSGLRPGTACMFILSAERRDGLRAVRCAHEALGFAVDKMEWAWAGGLAGSRVCGFVGSNIRHWG